MKPETLQIYTTNYKEKYNSESDELCAVWSKLKQVSLEEKPTPEPTPSDKIILWLSCLRSSIKFCLLLKVPSKKILPNEEKEHLVCLNTYQVTRSLHILRTEQKEEDKKARRKGAKKHEEKK